jgi:hypothetical protein
MRRWDTKRTVNERILTVYQTLHKRVRGALYLADRLIIEHDHLATNHNGTSGEGEQRNVDILLPEVTDQIDQIKYGKRL